MTKPLETRLAALNQLPRRSKHCRNHSAACAGRGTLFTDCFPALRVIAGRDGFSQDRLPSRSVWRNAMNLDVNTLVPRDHLRGSDPRIAAAVRLGAKYRDHGRSLVGLCASVARRLGDAVRSLRLGIRSDLDRSRQRAPVHLLCRDLDRRAAVRSSPAAAGIAVRRRRAVADRLPHSRLRRLVRCARAALELGHHHRLHLGHGVRILARAQRASGVALAGDLHAVRARRALSAAHAARRDAAVAADRQSGVRERLAHRAQLRGAAVHDRDRLHPAGDGERAHRAPPQDGGAWSIR